jgi:hypothetical protein
MKKFFLFFCFVVSGSAAVLSKRRSICHVLSC